MYRYILFLNIYSVYMYKYIISVYFFIYVNILWTYICYIFWFRRVIVDDVDGREWKIAPVGWPKWLLR